MPSKSRFQKAAPSSIACFLLALSGCGDSNSPFANLSASNNADDFLFIAQTFNHQVSTTNHYIWPHTANVAQVLIGLSSGGTTPVTGTATMVVRDAAGAQVYSHSLSGMVEDTTAAGMPGDWTVDFTFVGVNGDIVVELKRAPRDLIVTTTTDGAHLDTDGYTVTMDGGATMTVAANGTVTFSKVTPASHTVVLSGVAANCTLNDGDTRTAIVPAAVPIGVSFSLTCP